MYIIPIVRAYILCAIQFRVTSISAVRGIARIGGKLCQSRVCALIRARYNMCAILWARKREMNLLSVSGLKEGWKEFIIKIYLFYLKWFIKVLSHLYTLSKGST